MWISSFQYDGSSVHFVDFEENTCSTTSSVVMVDFDDLNSQGLLQFTDSGRACDYLHRCTTKSNNSDQCSSTTFNFYQERQS